MSQKVLTSAGLQHQPTRTSPFHPPFYQVGAAIKKLSVEDILSYEKSGSLSVAGHTLQPGDIKVRAGSKGGALVSKLTNTCLMFWAGCCHLVVPSPS